MKTNSGGGKGLSRGTEEDTQRYEEALEKQRCRSEMQKKEIGRN